MWSILGLLIGVLLSALPRRWRALHLLQQAIPWERSAILSGLLETALAFVALIIWYSHSVTTWAANALESALHGGPEAQVPGQAIGFSALVLWCLHPLTWFIAYFVIEGIVRFVAAISAEQILPLSALAIADWSYGKFTHRPPEGDALHTPPAREQLRSAVTATKEAVYNLRNPALPDEIVESKDGADSILEIHSSRRKCDWDPPRVVRIAETYYRLEFLSEGKHSHPFVYSLRRLPAGVPGRNVLVYEPPQILESSEPT